MSSRYTVGKIVDIVKSKDRIVRRATVEYQNASESKTRQTDRAARTLIKLFNIEDTTWKDDMFEVEQLVKKLQGQTNEEEQGLLSSDNPPKKMKLEQLDKNGLKFRIIVDEPKLGEKLNSWMVQKRKCKYDCCCPSHCEFDSHLKKDKVINLAICSQPELGAFQCLLDRSWMDDDHYEEEMLDEYSHRTGLMKLICATATNLGDDWDDNLMDPVQFFEILEPLQL